MASDDRQLLKDCLDGKPGAWEAFLARHGPAMRQAALARLGSDAEAEEVCQKVLAKLSADGGRALSGFRGNSSLKTWLMAVAVSEASNHSRDESRCRQRLLRRPFPREAVPTPLQSLCRTEDVQRVRSAMAALSARDQLLLSLVYWDGLSHGEASRLLRVTPGSIDVHLSRAMDHLRRALTTG